MQIAATRNTAAWLHILDGLEAFVPEGAVYLITDGLPLNWSMDTMVWNWGHARFHFVPLPKVATWLNLIEGFWKILRQRALAGRTGCRYTPGEGLHTDASQGGSISTRRRTGWYQSAPFSE